MAAVVVEGDKGVGQSRLGSGHVDCSMGALVVVVDQAAVVVRVLMMARKEAVQARDGTVAALGQAVQEAAVAPAQA